MTILFILVVYISALFMLVYGICKPMRKKRGFAVAASSVIPSNPKITVVVLAHRQAEELSKLISKLLEQDYVGGIEVLVVLYNTDIYTKNVIERVERNHRNVRHTHIPEGAHFVDLRKLAVNIGIKAVRTDWFAIMDAYQAPLNAHWISLMAQHINPDTDLILGYAQYCNGTTKQTLLQCLAHINFCQTTNRVSAPMLGLIQNILLRKSSFNLKHLYDQESIKYEVGHICALIAPLIKAKRMSICTNPEAQIVFDLEKKNTSIIIKEYLVERHFALRTRIGERINTIIKDVILPWCTYAIAASYGALTILFVRLIGNSFECFNLMSVMLTSCIWVLFTFSLTILVTRFKRSLLIYGIEISFFEVLKLSLTLPIMLTFKSMQTFLERKNYKRKYKVDKNGL